ncbi:MAG TPA: 1,4-alpha-glucan branching enzyme, partial [Thiotrichales bacterium]|nr:1,4-alpha-glucan branching enzyme [Thiotrichales bacterium]
MNIAQQIQQGSYHDPFEWLGLHPLNEAQPADGYIIRAFMPTADTVEVDNAGVMTRVDGSDLFELKLSAGQKQQLPPHYSLSWTEKNAARVTTHNTVSPYSFLPQISQFDLDLFAAGKHLHVYRILGAHLKTIDGVDGCLFALWAPNVKRVSVIGDFNAWHGLRHPMRSLGQSGVWELFIPGLQAEDAYKFELLSQSGEILHKTDPYARRMGLRPETTSKITPAQSRAWQDEAWLQQRGQWQWLHQPVSVYEVHLGSWRKNKNGGFLS